MQNVQFSDSDRRFEAEPFVTTRLLLRWMKSSANAKLCCRRPPGNFLQATALCQLKSSWRRHVSHRQHRFRSHHLPLLPSTKSTWTTTTYILTIPALRWFKAPQVEIKNRIPFTGQQQHLDHLFQFNTMTFLIDSSNFIEWRHQLLLFCGRWFISWSSVFLFILNWLTHVAEIGAVMAFLQRCNCRKFIHQLAGSDGQGVALGQWKWCLLFL